MPEMGGLEATVAIRAREGSGPRRVPIVALTAHAMQGDRQRCLSAGMDGYLSKPIDVDDLYTTVESFASPGRVTMSSAGQAAAAAALVVFDETGAMRRTGDDRQLLKKSWPLHDRLCAVAARDRARDRAARRRSPARGRAHVERIGRECRRADRPRTGRAARRDGPIESTGCGSAGARRAERRVGRPLRRVRGRRPGRAPAQARGATPPAAREAGPARPETIMSPQRILIVDDDQGTRHLIRAILSRGGYQTAMAKDGADALRILRTKRFDLLLLDVWMPRMTGLDLLERLQRRKSRPRIVIMTSDDAPETLLKAVRRQAFTYVHEAGRAARTARSREGRALRSGAAVDRSGVGEARVGRARRPVHARRGRTPAGRDGAARRGPAEAARGEDRVRVPRAAAECDRMGREARSEPEGADCVSSLGSPAACTASPIPGRASTSTSFRTRQWASQCRRRTSKCARGKGDPAGRLRAAHGPRQRGRADLQREAQRGGVRQYLDPKDAKDARGSS